MTIQFKLMRSNNLHVLNVKYYEGRNMPFNYGFHSFFVQQGIPYRDHISVCWCCQFPVSWKWGNLNLGPYSRTESKARFSVQLVDIPILDTYEEKLQHMREHWIIPNPCTNGLDMKQKQIFPRNYWRTLLEDQSLFTRGKKWIRRSPTTPCRLLT